MGGMVPRDNRAEPPRQELPVDLLGQSNQRVPQVMI